MATVREGAATAGSAVGGGTRTGLKKSSCVKEVSRRSSSSVRIAVGFVVAMGHTCAAPLKFGSLFHFRAEAGIEERGMCQEEDEDYKSSTDACRDEETKGLGGRARNGAVSALRNYGRATRREGDGGGLREAFQKSECGGNGDGGASGSMISRTGVSG